MFILFKRTTLLVLFLFMATIASAQVVDTVIYSEADSMQDVVLKELERKIRSVHSSLWMIDKEHKELTDSMGIVNEEQAEQIDLLLKEAEILGNKLQQAETEIEMTEKKLQESRKKFSSILYVTVPILLLITLVLTAFLYVMVRKYKNSADLQINSLRKYTYEELEDVKAGYVDEIKRRVKKLATKFKPVPKKNKAKKDKKEKSKSSKKENVSK